MGDAWWPTVARRVHRRLGRLPQGLPEDPLAHGVLSWVEYELAVKPRDQWEASAAAPPGGGPSGSEEGGGAASDVDLDKLQPIERGPNIQEAPFAPLPTDVDWRWA